MFGGRKVVRAAAGRRVTAAQLKPLVEGGDLQGYLIVEAGNLRPDDALRALFEKSAAAAAVACFPDEARDLEGVIREVFGAAKAADHAGRQRLLLARLGADRALSRAEIEKLALYAHGKSTDRGERRRGRRRRRRRAGARPYRHGRRLGPDVAAALAECDRSVASRRERAGRHRRAAAAFPAPAPHARRARCRPVHGGRPAPAAPAAALQAEGRHRAAVPQLEPAKLNAALARIAEAAKAARLNSALEGALAENCCWTRRWRKSAGWSRR